jgi:two-component system, chemotaxis family, CheB/CheR fusion protein
VSCTRRHATQEYLQSTIEELEVANEELKSTNEEFQSAYEELQSTNEELQTAKEELQSVNEELQTVNVELQTNNEILRESNTDLNNLLSNIEIPIIFLDQKLRIKRFNPAAIQMINLIPSDVGRPVEDMASNLLHPDLMDDVHDVLKTLIPKDIRVQLRDKSWHLLRIRIYRSLNNAVEGLILMFTDLAERSEAR